MKQDAQESGSLAPAGTFARHRHRATGEPLPIPAASPRVDASKRFGKAQAIAVLARARRSRCRRFMRGADGAPGLEGLYCCRKMAPLSERRSRPVLAPWLCRGRHDSAWRRDQLHRRLDARDSVIGAGADRARPARARATPLVAGSTVVTAALPVSPGRRSCARPGRSGPPSCWTFVRSERRRLQGRGGASARLEQSDGRPCERVARAHRPAKTAPGSNERRRQEGPP